MTNREDHQLLADFARDKAEPAFAALVERHVNLVYATALRSVGNAHAAQEISQAVFIILAQKAGKLSSRVVLSGWLYQTTRLTAANFLRGEIRRQKREQEAYMQSTLNEPENNVWPQIAPLLDNALGKLGEADRNAIVLHFLENKNLREVGAALGASEDAAKMRVNRALEKLRKMFTKRGVTLSVTLIAGAVSTGSVHAAPAGLAKTISIVAITKGAAAGGSTLALVNGALKIMAWTKAKTAVVVGVGVLLATGTTAVLVKEAGTDREAQTILERVEKTYTSLSSYDSTGTTEERIDSRTLAGSFTLRLGRTNFYRLEYEFHGPGLTNKGAAWSDGSGDYFANDLLDKASKPPGAGVLNTNRVVKWPIPGLAHNLGSLGDLTGGATRVVPSLFFGIQIPGTSDGGKLNMAYVVKEADEKVGETDCYVLSSETDGEKNSLWIGKQDFLVHKSRQSITSKLTDITDAEVTAMLNATPGKPTLSVKEIRQRINAARKKASATMQPVTIIFKKPPAETGLESLIIQPPDVVMFTQTHENIVVNQKFSPADFAR